MKFDNFYKFIVNEAIDDNVEEFPETSGIPEPAPIVEKEPETDDEKEDFILQVLKQGAKNAGREIDINKLRNVARSLVDVGGFDKFYEKHATKVIEDEDGIEDFSDITDTGDEIVPSGPEDVEQKELEEEDPALAAFKTGVESGPFKPASKFARGRQL